jgi:hypothetical protein
MRIAYGSKIIKLSTEQNGPAFTLKIEIDNVEKELTLDKRCAKPVMRFLKQFRDTNKPLVNLKRYALKTVFIFHNNLSIQKSDVRGKN